MKNVFKVTGLFIGIILVLAFMFFLKVMNEKSVMRNYNIDCFAGCRHESKCPYVAPYHTLNDLQIENEKEYLDITTEEFEEVKKECAKK